MNMKRLFAIALLAMILSGCSTPGTATQPTDADQPPGEPPATSPVEPPATTAPEPPPDVSPLEWLIQASFEAHGGGEPDILPADLPEGFDAFEPEHQSGELPTGFFIYGSSISFERPVGGQVVSEDYVSADLYSYDSIEARTSHLNLLAEAQEGGTWEFYELDGHRIVRYLDGSGEALIWVSGPYLVTIYNALDASGSAPWVDTFASLFLVMFPPS
jgi:hypothetical protein